MSSGSTCSRSAIVLVYGDLDGVRMLDEVASEILEDVPQDVAVGAF
jgi:hypothetical protein